VTRVLVATSNSIVGGVKHPRAIPELAVVGSSSDVAHTSCFD